VAKSLFTLPSIPSHQGRGSLIVYNLSHFQQDCRMVHYVAAQPTMNIHHRGTEIVLVLPDRPPALRAYASERRRRSGKRYSSMGISHAGYSMEAILHNIIRKLHFGCRRQRSFSLGGISRPRKNTFCSVFSVSLWLYHCYSYCQSYKIYP